jgi:hypothetical protein
LARTDRIGDPNYLAAQLFYEFAIALGNYDGNLSFGIDATGAPAESYNKTVYVDLDNGTYTYDDVVYDRYGNVTIEPLSHLRDTH